VDARVKPGHDAKNVFGITLLALLVLLLAGPALAAEFPRGTLTVATAGGRHAFAIEMATSEQQLAQGLMYRRRLDADAGMLFDFGQVRPVSMWMRNTFIPLDMLFIAADGRVVSIAERTVPESLTVLSAPEPVRAVLEVNGGTAARLGIRPGDKVVHPLFGPER
jgi:uncharacterized membrane protein (UPF0127 family)